MDQATRAFHVMAKPAGPLCNLDCTYCFYLEKERLYPQTKTFDMGNAVLETFVRQYIEGQPTPVVSFAWQGGEPTLRGLAFFERVVELQQKFAGGRRIENALQTNGILLDDAWCGFLARHQFLVGISVDGPELLHDRYRVDRGGRPTFARVMQALECMKKHGVSFNTLTTVHRGNVGHPAAVYRFLKEIGSHYPAIHPGGRARRRRKGGECPDPREACRWCRRDGLGVVRRPPGVRKFPVPNLR